MFKGVLIEKDEASDSKSYNVSVKSLDDSVLMDGDTVINVAYSTLNYKDALAITGNFSQRLSTNLPSLPR